MQMIFCPRCGRRLERIIFEGKERPVCVAASGGCGYIDYGRFTLGVGGVVVIEEGAERRVLLIQRNQEPNRGGWTIPGGYVERDETAEVAVVREVAEETGLQCELIGMVGFRNRVDPDSNSGYAMFMLRPGSGNLIATPNEEIADVRFFAQQELNPLARLTPLSRTVALAALTGRLPVLHGQSVASIGNRPPVNVFMGDSQLG